MAASFAQLGSPYPVQTMQTVSQQGFAIITCCHPDVPSQYVGVFFTLKV